MAVQAYNLIPKRTKKTHRVVKNSFTAIIPDASFLGETVQKIAANEIMREIKNGNNPQNIIVDNRDSKPFNEADFRVTALFSDSKVIAIAAYEVLRTLKKLTRVDTTLARSSYEVWTVKGINDPGTRVYKNANFVSRSSFEKLAEGLPPNGRIVIAGPMVDYGRKLYWNPKSSRKLKGRARYHAAYEESTGKFLRTRLGTRDTSMKDLLLGRVKRKYPGALIIGRWVKGKSVGQHKNGNRWPGIAIGLKSKGRL